MNNTAKLPPLTHSPDSAAQRIGITTRAVYQKIADGELRSFKIGKRRLILDSECQALVERAARAGVAA